MSEHETLYVYGRRPVEEALRSGRVQKVYVLYGSEAERSIPERARRVGVPCTVLSADRFAEVAKAAGIALRKAQGVIALLTPVSLLTVEELLQRIPSSDTGLLVAADGIEDPHNLGALARCADAAGAHGLIIPRYRAAPLTPAAVKASAGALLHLPLAQVTNLGQALRRLQTAGWWIVGTAADGEHIWWEPLYDRPLVLVIGNEHSGMRPSIRALCDFVVCIPMFGHVGSLNAAAAAAVVLFEIQRQRWHAGLLRSVPLPQADNVPN